MTAKSKPLEVRVVIEGQTVPLPPFDALLLLEDGAALLPSDATEQEKLYLWLAGYARRKGRSPAPLPPAA